MNFDFSFDFKPNSIPDGYGHVLQVGQTEVSSYEDSMAFIFYNKNDYFQGRIYDENFTGNFLWNSKLKYFKSLIKVFVRGMEPKGIFPTVTLDIDTWNEEKGQIVENRENHNLIFLIHLKDPYNSLEAKLNKMSNRVFGKQWIIFWIWSWLFEINEEQ